MRSLNDIKKIIKKFNVKPRSVMKSKVLNDALQMQRNRTRQNIPDTNTWRIIMNNKTTKFATAAAIILVAITIINQFDGSIDGSSVAWASLSERVGRIQTCFFKSHSKITGGSLAEKTREQEAEIYISSEYGTRSNSYADGNIMSMQYSILAEKAMVIVSPTEKHYIRMLLTDEMVEKMRLQGNDPKAMIMRIMQGEYTHLGESVIDGVKVEGIETTDTRAGGGQFKKYLARCWVDIETQLPVQLEMEAEMSAEANMPPMKVSVIADSFEWGVDIAPEIFKPDIPSDYKLMAETQVPDRNEGSTVNGLRVFAEISGGKYPEALSMMRIGGEVGTTVQTKYEKEWQSKVDIDPTFKPTEDEKNEIRAMIMDKIMTVRVACVFYAELVMADKDVAYYGDKVTSDDVDAVLLRWKISEDEYRVIFGDLTTENVSAEDLVELERLTLE